MPTPSPAARPTTHVSLTVTGSPAGLAAFKEAVRSKSPDSNSVFDFQEIVPVPSGVKASTWVRPFWGAYQNALNARLVVDTSKRLTYEFGVEEYVAHWGAENMVLYTLAKTYPELKMQGTVRHDGYAERFHFRIGKGRFRAGAGLLSWKTWREHLPGEGDRFPLALALMGAALGVAKSLGSV